MIVAANRVELLQIADAVAREKMISRDVVIHLLEEAIERAARSTYGAESDIRASLHPLSGHVDLVKVRRVIPDDQVPSITEMNLSLAQKIDPNAEVGDEIKEALPVVDFGRIAAQSARQVIAQKLKDAEKEGQWEEFKDRVGQNIHGVVRQVNRDARPPGRITSVVVELSRGEGIIMGGELIPRENPRIGDPIRAYIYDVKQDPKGHQVFLSRTRVEFVYQLFMQEVPEIFEGIIHIQAIARDPGSRTKIAVSSRDPNIDPVGSCVGLGGSRVRAVTKELQGEKIDVILWDEDLAVFVMNTVSPKVEISKLVIDEDRRRVEIIVPESDFPVIIGRGGQNTRLLSQLTKCDVTILTNSEESQRREVEAERSFHAYTDVLGFDEDMAKKFVAHGFGDMTDIAYASVEDLTALLASQDLAQDVQRKAAIFVKDSLLREKCRQQCRQLGLSIELTKIAGLGAERLMALSKNRIRTVSDLADLAADELTGYEEGETHVPGILEETNITLEEAEEMVMQARRMSHMTDDVEQTNDLENTKKSR